jgi:hypothetical protein
MKIPKKRTCMEPRGFTMISFRELAFISDSVVQRVSNDLQRARLSRRRMVWLLAHPLLPSVSRAANTQGD